MEPFFIFLELMTPIAMVLLILKKGSLAIIYMPVFFFSSSIFEETKYIPGPFYYYMFVGLLLYFVFFNLPLFRKNIYANIIILYFAFLVLQVDDFQSVKKDFLNVMWLFICIPLIPEIYKYHSKEKILSELNISIFVLVALFVVNSLLSTYFGYNPRPLYGVSTGVSYGKISINILNMFPYALFLLLRKGVKDNNLYYIGLYFLALFLILLTMRRSVMALTLLGSLFVMIELVKFEDIKKFFLYAIVLGSVGLLGISQTNFLDNFYERLENRGIEDRQLNEEGRIIEFGLVYKDLFVYYDYSPWFGYGLFDSQGNYGKKIFGERSLHTDPTVLVHASGLLGLSLYLLMFWKAFQFVWNKVNDRYDILQFTFVLICFTGFCITGRFTVILPMLVMLLILYLPTAKKEMLIASNPDKKKSIRKESLV